MFKKQIFGLALTVLFCSGVCNASILTFNIGGAEFSGSGASSIANNAVVVTFNDFGGTGTVRVTIDFNGGTGVNSGAILNDLGLNALVAITGHTYVSGVMVNSFSSGGSYNIDGSHGYNVLFDFPPPTGAPRLNPGEQSVYDLTGVGLVASSFNTTNTGGGHGPFKAAVHINEVNIGMSGHYANTTLVIPEPGSLMVWAMSMGCIGVVGLRRRRV